MGKRNVVTLADVNLADTVNLLTVCDGSAVDLFSAELKRVLENIQDPSTDPKAAREITIKFKFDPAEERDAFEVFISARSKLGAVGGPSQVAFIQRNRAGGLFATSTQPRQQSLPMDEDETK